MKNRLLLLFLIGAGTCTAYAQPRQHRHAGCRVFVYLAPFQCTPCDEFKRDWYDSNTGLRESMEAHFRVTSVTDREALRKVSGSFPAFAVYHAGQGLVWANGYSSPADLRRRLGIPRITPASYSRVLPSVEVQPVPSKLEYTPRIDYVPTPTPRHEMEEAVESIFRESPPANVSPIPMPANYGNIAEPAATPNPATLQANNPLPVDRPLESAATAEGKSLPERVVDRAKSAVVGAPPESGSKAGWGTALLFAGLGALGIAIPGGPIVSWLIKRRVTAHISSLEDRLKNRREEPLPQTPAEPFRRRTVGR